MANFEIAVEHVFEHEGGYVNNINDPGGATNFGISLRYLTKRGDLLGDFDGDGDVDIDDITAMTIPQAKEAYRVGFWEPNQLVKLRSQLLANKIFDMAVNMGSKQAWKLAQRAVSAHGHSCIDDGVVGPKTLDCLNQVEKFDYEVLITIREMQMAFYTGIINRKPNMRAFKLGWFRRAVF